MKKLITTIVFLLVLLPVLGGSAAAAADISGGLMRVNEDIVIPAGQTVNGDVVAISGNIEVLGTVNGDVVSVLGDVIVRDSGQVRGEAIAVLGGLSGDTGAVLGSRVAIIERFPQINLPRWHWRIPYPQWLGIQYGSKVLGLLFQVLITAVLIAIAPRAVGRVQVSIRKNPLAAGGIGLLTILAGAALVFIFAITIIGIPVALLLGVLLGLAHTVAKYLGGAAIGLWVGQQIFKGQQSVMVSALVGRLLVGILLLIPFTGIIGMIVSLLALGGVVATCFGMKGEELLNA